MSKKVLILGASNAQIDAIKYCKSRGLKVGGCSYTTADNGIPMLDYFRRVDIKDAGGVAAFAREMGTDIVYSIGSDLAIPTAMKVSEMMELPHFISHSTAEKCHSKHLMREALGKDFNGNTRFIVCETLNDAEGYDGFPAMMKPVDSQGQRGCFRVDSFEDIKKYFAISFEYSIEGKVIIETFVDGPEISVNAYLQEGKMKFAIVSDRIVFEEYPGGIIKEHVIPSIMANKEVQKKAIELVARAAKKLGINDGPCYVQLKIDKSECPIILEIAPRLDGCHLWKLIKQYCGVDLLDACFSQLINNTSVLNDEFNIPNAEYRLSFNCKKTGDLFNKNEFDCSKAEEVFWYYEDGDVIRKVNGFVEKCGYMICKYERD